MTYCPRMDAERGSAILRDAILRSMGLLPPAKRVRRQPKYTSPMLWSAEDFAMLASMADAKIATPDIAKALGRSQGAIRAQAWKHGISLNRYRVTHRTRPADVSQWSEADKIAEWANVPQELAEIVVNICSARGLKVSDVRGESRAKDLVACRRAICVAARARRFSFPKIGRALDIDHTSAIYFTKSPLSTGRSAFVPPSEQSRIAA